MGEVKYTVRTMTKEDVPQTLDVWKETGLQEGTHSLYTWLAVDPEGVQVAVKDDGEIIGACSAVVHHEDFAFVGLYCVREKHRGKGIGIKVWNACMKHVGSRNVCLNAVPGKLELYRDKGGFPIVETEWVCVVNETDLPIKHENLSDTPPAGIDIVTLKESLLPLVYKYDQDLIGYNRQVALQHTTKEQDSHTLVAMKDDTCVGFGIIKLSCQGPAQVGPLYADNKNIAEALLKKLILSLPQAKGFSMMTCSNNTHATELIKRIGCPTTEECERLYRKKKIDVDTNKVFAQFDLNFQPY